MRKLCGDTSTLPRHSKLDQNRPIFWSLSRYADPTRPSIHIQTCGQTFFYLNTNSGQPQIVYFHLKIQINLFHDPNTFFLYGRGN